MTPISGRLSDIYGKKKVLLILLILYTGGIIFGGFTNNITALLISRIVQGVGLAAVPVAFSILRGILVIIGTFGLFNFHSTEVEVSANLTIMAIGLALTNIIGWNILVSSSPKEYTGISVGVGALLFFLGMAIGPAVSGIYIQTYQTYIEGNDGLFPSGESFNMIFLTTVILSIVSLLNLLVLKKRMSCKKINSLQS